MRKLATILLLLLLSAAAHSQTYEEMKASFEEFADGVASTLPFSASLGLNWSDSHTGNFPHFGLGASVGGAIMPIDLLNPTLVGLGIDVATMSDESIKYILETFGMPYPSALAELRVGGFLLPFDIGFKLGYIPPDMDIPILPEGLVLNYFLAGGDLRIRILPQMFFIPEISAGAGITWASGSFDIPGILGTNTTIADVGGYTIEMTDPSLNFNWSTLVADLKGQISWDLFIAQPYLGFGGLYGFIANAGGGMKAQLINGSTGQPLTESEKQAIIDYYTAQGETPPDLSDSSILVSSATPPAWTFRAYGGIALNFFLVRLDATIMYNFLSGGLGGTIGARIQF